LRLKFTTTKFVLNLKERQQKRVKIFGVKRQCAFIWPTWWVFSYILRLLGREATSFPGYVALKIDPLFLQRALRRYQKVIVVTGTNGKTTVANLLARILRAAGLKVVHNQEGANLPAGLASTLISQKGDWALLEVDEGTLKTLARFYPSIDMVLITNLARDQTDRYPELSGLAEEIKDSLDNPQTRFILNGDDPYPAWIGQHKPLVRFFGLEGEGTEEGISPLPFLRSPPALHPPPL